MNLYSSSQPGIPSTSQPATVPQYWGPNSLLNPLADVGNANQAFQNSTKMASLIGGLSRLTDPSFWKGAGLLAAAAVAGLLGLWLWLGSGGQTNVTMAPAPQGGGSGGKASGGKGIEGEAAEAAEVA